MAAIATPSTAATGETAIGSTIPRTVAARPIATGRQLTSSVELPAATAYRTARPMRDRIKRATTLAGSVAAVVAAESAVPAGSVVPVVAAE